MNRNFTSILALILVGLAFGFLTGCGSSSSSSTPPPPPTIAITATSGSGQKANVGDAFTNMLVATVKSNGTAASGVTVTFTPAPGPTGQSCTPPPPLLPPPPMAPRRSHALQTRRPAPTQ